MTQIARPKPSDVVLEIGTGSGYQVSILSRIVKQAYSIEIIEPLGRGVAKIFKPLGYNNIQTRVGDGFFGWPEVKGGFDIIIVTCVAQYVPPGAARPAQARRPPRYPHWPAVQEGRPVPVCLHQRSERQGQLAQGRGGYSSSP